MTTLLVAVLAVGAAAAWSVGRNRELQPAAIAEYQAGPTADGVVRLSTEAARHEQAPRVQAVIQDYFDSINERDYQSWVGTVSDTQSAPQTEARWQHDYGSTIDSNLSVLVIADEPLRARMMFTSEQAVELAPPALAVDCINWDVTYLLSEQKDHLVLSGIDPSAQSMAACS
ncbi:MAG: hypothetical protein ABJD68_10960 [Nakamurella sp.]